MKKCTLPVADPLLKGSVDFLRQGFLVSERQRAGISARDPTPSTVENRHVRRTTGAPERAYREWAPPTRMPFRFVTRRMTCWFLWRQLTDLSAEPGVKGVVTADMLERIAMTPRTAKRLTLTLIQSLREYEARFGEIAVEEKAPEEE